MMSAMLAVNLLSVVLFAMYEAGLELGTVSGKRFK
jgi:hypothetical protein